MNGAFPPNSILYFFIDVDESAITFFAVSVDPIMVINFGVLLEERVVATSFGLPHKILTTPLGKFISFNISPII